VQKLVVAALALSAIAIALLMVRKGPEPVAEEPAVDARDADAPQQVASRQVEPAPLAAPGSPEAKSPAIPRPPEAAPELGETSSSLQADPNWGLGFALFQSREDDVDACRDRYTPPPMADLVSRSRLIAAATPGGRPVQEIDMHQIILFEISSVKDGFWLDSAKVLETSLEFPAPDGSRRRAIVVDASLNRCVESALAGARVPGGMASGERLSVKVFAGEAVYDLR
jgi:hypothetical protein